MILFCLEACFIYGPALRMDRAHLHRRRPGEDVQAQIKDNCVKLYKVKRHKTIVFIISFVYVVRYCLQDLLFSPSCKTSNSFMMSEKNLKSSDYCMI